MENRIYSRTGKPVSLLGYGTMRMPLNSEDNKDKAEKPADNIAEIIVAKNRHGSTGTVKMGWEGQYTRFTTLDSSYDEN